jgi:hypothetical protein
VLRAPSAIPVLERAASIYRQTGARKGEDLALAGLRLARKSARWQRWLPQPVVRRLSWSTVRDQVLGTDRSSHDPGLRR